MAEDTSLTITGNAVEAPELRFTSGGSAVAKFRVASTPRYFDKATSAFKDGEPLFLRVVVWRQMAEHVAEVVTKGTRLVVVGRLKSSNWETKEGEKRSGLELEADEVAVSLKFATATVQKMSRSGGSGQGRNTNTASEPDPWASAQAGASAGKASTFEEEPPF